MARGRVWNLVGIGALVAGVGLVSAPVTATAVSSVPTITWSNHVQTAPTGSWGRGDGWSSVAYGNGKFIAVGATTTTGAVSVSSDGQSWTTTATSVGDYWSEVVYGNSEFVAIGTNNSNSFAMTSTDGGTSWSVHPLANLLTYWTSCIWTGTEFIAADYQGNVATSTDGSTWTLQTPIAGANIGALVSQGSTIYAYGSFGGNPTTWTSTDGGSSWTSQAAPFSGYGAAVGAGTFVLVRNPPSGTDTTSPVVATSTDGTTFTTATGGEGIDWNQVSYGEGLFVAEADPYGAVAQPVVMVSADGTNWVLQPGANALMSGRWSAIGPGVIVTVGDSGQIETGTFSIPTTPTTMPAPVPVTPATLPNTGTNLGFVSLIGLVFVGCGAVGLVLRRRSRRAAQA